MSDTAANQVLHQQIIARGGIADRTLQISGISWFLVAALGQWVFVYYLLAHYPPIFAKKGMPGLADTSMPGGYVPGDLAGNLAITAHVLIAIIIIGGGPLQLIPAIRNRFRAFHRWMGRTYVTFSVLTSTAGLYLVWTRGVPGGMVGHLAISLDAVLIYLFAGIAVYFAVTRQIDRHRRWAMRLFMVVSAVWFFRIGIMFWFMTTGGVGIDPETFEGPALKVLYFGQMFIPLAILQLYFNAQDSDRAALKIMAAITVFAATTVTAVGTFAATMGMWLPRL
ncbi:MAG: DUF2306 domain-containing protein [Marinicaulis sp.]|nr:DUF2306 domain-containing protein [Marinicaulis sp.]NNE40478.1 DUF2306 domain-containing protein [Marinicaulis sp.]NNL89566.1 DUF2306 domain-containing protein [Marinicaulis sp.]